MFPPEQSCLKTFIKVNQSLNKLQDTDKIQTTTQNNKEVIILLKPSQPNQTILWFDFSLQLKVVQCKYTAEGSCAGALKKD